ncbi:MAG TPA: type I phosphomannose isomerase catalytic subunit [Candidatus Cybelea sp.]|nr:type I phosphomannose isomerase catalytic subunit [Candidatus Cybelea sp.]
MKLYPLTFEPIFKARIWGGRHLETLYGKPLPAGQRVGESWEICDRPGDESVVAHGPCRGRTLHWLMEQAPGELLGSRGAAPGRFPLLIKIIDAQDKLSLQVHPPADVAARLGGEPKTEMWYVAQAERGAELFVGLKKGVSRAEFERQLAAHTVERCFHRIAAKEGDAMFLPSGRVHALGAGMVIFEIQQNSDTTYRVFDWNRVDKDGKARELHLAQALASIEFGDYEPALLPRLIATDDPGTVRPLVRDDLFSVDLRQWEGGGQLAMTVGRMRIFGVVHGALRIEGAGEVVELGAGQFCLVPAQCEGIVARAQVATTFLEVR